MGRLFAIDELLGRVWLPRRWDARVSYPGGGALKSALRECGIFLARQARPVYSPEGIVLRYELVWTSFTHNERVDAGAAEQAVQCFAGSGSPASPSATKYPSVIAVATTGFTTKTKTDQSIGTSSAGVTTNEFTSGGLSRHAVTAPAGGDYTAPSSLGGQFTQNLAYQFTSTATQTAHGGAVFDSSTVGGSVLYCEDVFSADASLLSSDTLKLVVQLQN
jgi:hypothetical protein